MLFGTRMMHIFIAPIQSSLREFQVKWAVSVPGYIEDQVWRRSSQARHPMLVSQLLPVPYLISPGIDAEVMCSNVSSGSGSVPGHPPARP